MDHPISIENRSFRLYQDAASMLNWLQSETGQSYIIVPDQHFGYTVVKNIQAPSSSSLNENGLVNRRFRQSLLGFLEYYVWLVIGIVFYVNANGLLDHLTAIEVVAFISRWIPFSTLLFVTRLIGIVAMIKGLSFLYSYYAEQLFFERDGVVFSKGIIGRDQLQIRYSDIKTVEIHQGIIDRFLSIGTLELDTAGRAGSDDIVFHHLPNPSAIRKQLQAIIDQSFR